MPLDDRAIAISATFTAEALQPGLAFWAGELGLDAELRFSGYNQLFQQLLDSAGVFGSNRGGYNVALVRFDDWVEAGAEEQARRLVTAVHTAAAAFSVPLILVCCPAAPGREADFAEARRVVREGVAGLASVFPIWSQEIAALYPVEEVHDPHANQLGHMPYTPEYFAALATAIARKIHAISAPPFKLVALDCDDTLWAGICGEDGPQGVAIDEPRRALQQFMQARRAEGFLLALASKNNEEDVVETFRAHRDMPLRFEDFVARRIDWGSKGPNLASIADELQVGIDSVILVDDNPKECTEAEAGAPGVLVLPLPADSDEIPDFLNHVWAFDRAHITDEDRQRPERYAQQAERIRFERSSASLQEFLASLRLEVTIRPMEPGDVARVAQLTRRTNQMNATLIRRSEPEIQALGSECLTVSVTDRFGSYGLTGVVIFDAVGDALAVDTFLLSCRALGRGVEHRMIARLGEIAVERGLARVEVAFQEGQRNRPARLFFESLASAGPDGVYRLPAAEAAAVQANVAAIAPAPAAGESAPKPPAPVRRADYLRIATELRRPAAVLERIRGAAPRAASPSAATDPPRTPLERELAGLWEGLLNVSAVGVHDNFFELGGHSLLAVQLLSRVRQVCGVELSLEVVYSGEFTVAELAKAVELKEIEGSGAGYEDLLEELEGLSDEEVRALLAEEQDAN